MYPFSSFFQRSSSSNAFYKESQSIQMTECFLSKRILSESAASEGSAISLNRNVKALKKEDSIFLLSSEFSNSKVLLTRYRVLLEQIDGFYSFLDRIVRSRGIMGEDIPEWIFSLRDILETPRYFSDEGFYYPEKKQTELFLSLSNIKDFNEMKEFIKEEMERKGYDFTRFCLQLDHNHRGVVIGHLLNLSQMHYYGFLSLFELFMESEPRGYSKSLWDQFLIKTIEKKQVFEKDCIFLSGLLNNEYFKEDNFRRKIFPFLKSEIENRSIKHIDLSYNAIDEGVFELFIPILLKMKGVNLSHNALSLKSLESLIKPAKEKLSFCSCIDLRHNLIFSQDDMRIKDTLILLNPIAAH